MKKFTKFFSAILAVIMLCGLAGCSERDPNISQSDPESSGAAHNSEYSELFVSSSASSSSSVSSGDTSSSAQNESSEPVKIDLEMDDQLISLPCEVKDIKNINIKRGFDFSVKKRDNGTYMSSSLFDCSGTDAGAIYLEGDCSKIADLSGETVIGIVVGDDRVHISYKGLTFGSSKDDIVRTLGDPVDETETYLYYHIETEGSVTFTLDDDKVSNIAIFLNMR